VRRGHQNEHDCVNEDVRDTVADHLRTFVAVEENTSVTSVSFVLALFNFDPTSQFVVCLFVCSALVCYPFSFFITSVIIPLNLF